MKTMVSYSESQFVRSSAWRDWELEDTSYAIGFSSVVDDEETILIRDVFVPKPEEVKRERYYVKPNAVFLCEIFSAILNSGAAWIIQKHTHPFCDKPDFSGMDNTSAEQLLHDLKKFCPGVKVLQVVYGFQNKHASARIAIQGENGDCIFQDVKDLMIVGNNGVSRREFPSLDADKISSLEIAPSDIRNVQALGEKAVHSLQKLRVLVFGAGGLGSAIMHQLVHLGVHNISPFDFDRIDASNLNRLYFVFKARTAINRLKASFMAKAMRLICPGGKFHPVNASIYNEKLAAEAVKRSDVVVVTLDTQAGRSSAMELCGRYGKPLVNVSNSIVLDKEKHLKHAFACSQWFIPRESQYPCLRCQGGLDQKTIDEELMPKRLKEMRKRAGYIIGTDKSPAPQVIPINSIAAGIAAWEIVLWASGIKSPTPWIHFDVMQNQFRVLHPTSNPDCTVCGSSRASCLVTGDADSSLANADAEAKEELLVAV